MKLLDMDTIKFEIYQKSDELVFHMDEDREAPVVFYVEEPKKIRKLLSIVSLINFKSDLEIKYGKESFIIERLVFVVCLVGCK